jgi:hypothetical protein
MAADVQDWLDSPASNFGWILIGDEATPFSAKRYASSDNPVVEDRPTLTVDYTAAPAGSGSIDGPLAVGKSGSTDLALSWGDSCVAGDTDFVVYEGSLGSPASPVPLGCSTLGATSVTITPSEGNRFYLVVPNDGALEGSYGKGIGGLERPPSALACLPQSIAACL